MGCGSFDILWFWSKLRWSRTEFGDFEGLDCWVFMGFGFCTVGVKSKYCEIRNPSWNKKISGRRCETAPLLISSWWRSSARSHDGWSCNHRWQGDNWRKSSIWRRRCYTSPWFGDRCSLLGFFLLVCWW